MKKSGFLLLLLFLVALASSAQEQTMIAEITKDNIEPYYFSVIMDGPYDDVATKVNEALQKQGFGVITFIDFDQKMKDKLGVDMRKYVILGACSPKHAYAAVQAEDKIGTMLPCNVIIQETENGKFEVAAVNPIASMMAIQNEALVEVAMEVTNNLKRVIESLQE